MTLSDRQSVSANATVANAMSGKSQEFLSAPSLLRFFASAAAVGMFMTFLIGDRVILEDQEVNAANRMPLDPDDFLADAAGMPGERIVVKYRNSTAAAIVAFSQVKITPLA